MSSIIELFVINFVGLVVYFVLAQWIAPKKAANISVWLVIALICGILTVITFRYS
jgi:hypothetical protein